MSKKPSPPDKIDPQSDAPVLEYVGGRVPSGVPARDLHGGDLARIAYVRALHKAEDELDLHRPQGAEDTPLQINMPGQPTGPQLAALAAELIDSGAFAPMPETDDEPDSGAFAPTKQAAADAVEPED